MNWKSVLMIASAISLSRAAYSQPTSTERAKPPSAEAFLLGFIHEANQNEVALSRLAQQNSNLAQVTEFANQMIADHTRDDRQLLAFADRHNISLPSLDEMSVVQAVQTDVVNRAGIGTQASAYGFSSPADFQPTIDRLRNLQGPDFDREFARAMVKDHQLVFERLLVARTWMTDPDEVKFVEQLLPNVNLQLSLAQNLMDVLNT